MLHPRTNFCESTIGSTEHPQEPGGSSGGGSAGSGGECLKGLWGVKLVEVAAVLGGWLDL